MLLAIVVVVILASVVVLRLLFKPTNKQDGEKISDPMMEITPLNNFQWHLEEPIKYRPMKLGPFKMTMGLKSIPREEQFVIDKTYLNKIQVRSKITDSDRAGQFIMYQDKGIDAVREYYDYCMQFMCRRYPTCFVKEGDWIWNKVKDERIPASASHYKRDETMDLLHTLAKTIEEDVVILLHNLETDEYVLRAGIFLLPSGFRPDLLLGKSLAGIHTPVPQYESRLKFSMDKFFSRMPVNKFVMRNNWSIQTHQNLNDVGANHGKPGQVPVKLKLDDLDFNKTFLRSERQVLTRLPQSQLCCMTIKTYFTPLNQLREEELGRELLCLAIEGLSGDIAIYKNKLKWDQLVLDYLTRKSNGVNENFEEFLFQS